MAASANIPSSKDSGINDDYVVLDEEEIPDNNLPLDVEQRKSRQPQEERLKVLVLGKKGSGKTTLVQSFVDDQESGENQFIKVGPNTEEVDCSKEFTSTSIVDVYSTSMCGVHLEFYDSRGLCDGSADCDQLSNKKLLQEINKEVPGGFNLVFICIRMDQEVDQSLVSALLEISNVYGSALWERTIFVLTFANVYSQQLDNSEDLSLNMKQHVEDLMELLHKRLVSNPRWLYSIKESTFKSIQFYMAGVARRGRPKDRILPTTQDWVQDLLVACISQSTSEPVSALKLDQDKKRVIIEAGTVGTTAAVGAGTGAFIGGTIGTVIFPGVGTLMGAGIGSLIGGGIGTAAGGGTVVGMRISDKKAANSQIVSNDKKDSSSTDYIVDRSKQILTSMKSRLKKS